MGRHAADGGGRSEGVDAEGRARALSRADRRRVQEERDRAERARRSIWRAWWFYLLLMVVIAVVYLGLTSASQPSPSAPVVTTSSTQR